MDIAKYEDMVETLSKPGQDIVDQFTFDKAHLLHMAVGISGEVAELVNAFFLHLFQAQPLDTENITEELGDLEFFTCGYRKGCNLSRNETAGAIRQVLVENAPDNLTSCLFGLTVASGELLDAAKRHTIYNKELEVDRIREEMVNLESYLDGIRNLMSISRNSTLEHNMNKLLTGKNARFREGYSDAAAIARVDKDTI